MPNDQSQLQLAYSFTSTPQIISASQTGSNPNKVDIQVIVSNPGLTKVTVQKITIVIPVGEDSARALSSDADLPPILDAPANLSITSKGSIITISPDGRKSIEIGISPITFSLKSINVNDTPGNVPISITEFNPLAYGNSSLLKQPASCPVTSYCADPPVLYDLDQITTLKWTCGDLGKDYTYQVVCDGWHPPEIGRDGPFSVITQPLSQTTTFTLNVMKAEEVCYFLCTTVQVIVPYFSQDYNISQTSRCISLQWVAYNAVKCTVLLDGVVICDNVPTDTYTNGFSVFLTCDPGTYQLSVRAYSKSGNYATLQLGDVTVNQSFVITLDPPPWGFCFTPDSNYILQTRTVYNPLDYVIVIDTSTFTPESVSIPLDADAYSISVTQDGSLALVNNISKADVIDIANRKLVDSIEFVPPFTCNNIAVLPDGKNAAFLLNSINGMQVTIKDINSHETLATIGVGYDCGALYAPAHSNYLFATGSSLYMIDTQSYQLIGTMELDTNPIVPVITPDGNSVLYLYEGKGSITGVYIFDISSQTTGSIITTYSPMAICITPDGGSLYAVEGSPSSIMIEVIDIAKRQVVNSFNVDVPVPDIAKISFSPDGKFALLIPAYLQGQGGEYTNSIFVL